MRMFLCNECDGLLALLASLHVQKRAMDSHPLKRNVCMKYPLFFGPPLPFVAPCSVLTFLFIQIEETFEEGEIVLRRVRKSKNLHTTNIQKFHLL